MVSIKSSVPQEQKVVTIEFTFSDRRAMAPRNAYGNDAGWDLFVLEDTNVGEVIPQWVDVRTGIHIALPEGYYARLLGRSSAIRKRGVIVHEGIIDAGFRGELFCCCSLLDPYGDSVILKAGESICQLIVQSVEPAEWLYVTALPDSTRGERGFGSSGR